MPTFHARLRLPGQGRLPMNVVVDISDERLALRSSQKTLGEWALQEIGVETKPDGFHLTLDQEEIVLSVVDPARFAGELGVAQKMEQIRGADLRTPPPGTPHNGAQKRNGVSSRLNGVDLEEQFDGVKRRISALATALTDESAAPSEFFGRWLSLLKEINLRHGQGAMPTPLFYRLNTELLDLIPAPVSSTRRQ